MYTTFPCFRNYIFRLSHCRARKKAGLTARFFHSLLVLLIVILVAVIFLLVLVLLHGILLVAVILLVILIIHRFSPLFRGHSITAPKLSYAFTVFYPECLVFSRKQLKYKHNIWYSIYMNHPF